MITNIPTAADYEKTALSLLNLAWETTLELAVVLNEAKRSDPESVEEQQYWSACHTQLTTAISLVQQALEFELKSRIAAVSPYLLIPGPPDKWPKRCNTSDLPFADFYAIDAQELLRAHDTVASQRLPEAIKLLFTDLRKRRNSIMHTVDERLKIEVKEVILAVLEIADWCVGHGKWIATRQRHIEQSPHSVAYAKFYDHLTFFLAREVMTVVEMLPPAEIERLLGVDVKQRRYVCHSCLSGCRDNDFTPTLAFLAPNTPSSTNLHCYICGKDYAVIRQSCTQPDCKGNVIEPEEMTCLTCLATSDEPDAPRQPTTTHEAKN